MPSPETQNNRPLEDTESPMVVVENVSKSYGGRLIINNVSFKAPRKSITVILGSSGGGKSTLLKLLIGALKSDSGRVMIDGNDISQIRKDDLNLLRKHMGMLFQNVALFGELTVGENVALPIREHTDLDDAVVKIMVKMKLDQVGLSDFEELFPRELSGGMQKRVGIARATALDPKIVFFDEPTAGLDPVMSGVINKLIVDLTRLLGITSVVVTHDMDSALQIADRLVLLYDGKIYFEGTSSEINKSPDLLVQQFLHGSAEGPIPMRKSAEEYRKTLLE